eukprot:1152873-Pelagomonas_calceolata.AAC.3
MAEDEARAKEVATQQKAASMKARGAAGGAKEPKKGGAGGKFTWGTILDGPVACAPTCERMIAMQCLVVVMSIGRCRRLSCMKLRCSCTLQMMLDSAMLGNKLWLGFQHCQVFMEVMSPYHNRPADSCDIERGLLATLRNGNHFTITLCNGNHWVGMVLLKRAESRKENKARNGTGGREARRLQYIPSPIHSLKPWMYRLFPSDLVKVMTTNSIHCELWPSNFGLPGISGQ